MPKMTVKPQFDLAAHLAKPASAKEMENARKRRRWLEQYRTPQPLAADTES